MISAPGKDITSNQHTLWTTGAGNGQRGKRGCCIVDSKNVHEFLNSSELFNLYNVLNTLKNALLWTGKDEKVEDDDDEEEDYESKTVSLRQQQETRTPVSTPTTENMLSNPMARVGVAKKQTSIVVADDGASGDGKEGNDETTVAHVYRRDVVSANIKTIPHNDEQLEAKTETTTTNQMMIVNNSNNHNSKTTGGSGAGHIRRPSTASMASITSVSQMSDTESEISNENDSGVESEGHPPHHKRSVSGSSSCTESTTANTLITVGGGVLSSNSNGISGNVRKINGSSGSNGSSQTGVRRGNDSTSGSEDGLPLNNKKSANLDKATELAKRCRRHLNGLYQCLEQMTEAANYLTARYQNDIGGGSV